MIAAVPGIVVDDTGPEIGPDALKGLEVAQRAVLVRTGWSRHWGTERYVEQGHPYLTAAAADRTLMARPPVILERTVRAPERPASRRPCVLRLG
jgi:kynurenine formamidase